MSVNKKPSGAEVRKRAAKKQLEDEKLLKKVPKISNFVVVSEPKLSKCSLSGTQNIFESQSSDSIDIDTLGQPSTSDTDTLVLTQEPYSDSNTDTPKIKEQDQEDFVLEDPATWNIKDEIQVRKIIHSNIKQDLQTDFSKSERYKDVKPKRMLSVNLFFAQLPNGEKFKRDWLFYSKSTGRVFCIFCLLFQPEKNEHLFQKASTIGNIHLLLLSYTSDQRTTEQMF